MNRVPGAEEAMDVWGGMSPSDMGGLAGMTKKLPYQIDHQPMTVSGGAARLHELEPAFGPDIYGRNALQYFGSGDPRESKILGLLKMLRGKPDEMIDVYRGVPEDVSDINPGDWITLLPEYAEDYGKVISKRIPAKHVTSWPDSLSEFGYYPE